jgi:hypothetical protein
MYFEGKKRKPSTRLGKVDFPSPVLSRQVQWVKKSYFSSQPVIQAPLKAIIAGFVPKWYDLFEI